MTAVCTLTDLRALTPSDGDVVAVARKRIYVYESAAADTEDEYRVIAPSGGIGRWFRTGPDFIEVGDPGYVAVPSVISQQASGAASQSIVTLNAAGSFRTGGAICIYGAGSANTLAPPAAPIAQVHGATSGAVYGYRAIVIAEDKSYSAASPLQTVNAAATLDHANYVLLQWEPDAIPVGSYYLLLYRQKDGGSWQHVQGIIADPYRFRDPSLASVPRRVRIVDNGKTLSAVLSHFPAMPPSSGGAGVLRTWVTAGGGTTTLTVADRLGTGVNSTLIYHDAGLAIEKAIQDQGTRHYGGEIYVPEGSWPIHVPLYITKQTTLRGAGRRLTIMYLMDGASFVLQNQHMPGGNGGTAQNTTLRDFAVEARTKHTICCGGRVAESIERPPEAFPPDYDGRDWSGKFWYHAANEHEWTYGAAILLLTSAHVDNVDVRGVRGNGFFFYGWTYGDGEATSANCNNCALFDTRAVSNWSGHGYYFRGSNANNTLVLKGDAVNNHGWGWYDASQHGQTNITMHTSSNAQGAYATPGGAPASVYVGCYSESGLQNISSAGQASVIVGGVTGAPWRRGELSLKIIRTDIIYDFMGLELGKEGDLRILLGYPNSDTEIERVTYNPKGRNAIKYFRGRTGGDIREHWGTSAYESSRITGNNKRGTGLVQYRRGILIGDAKAMRKILAISGAADIPAGAYEVGDVFFDASGAVFALTPSARFGVKKATWAPRRIFRVGEVVEPTTPNGFTYVALEVSYRDGFSGVTAAVEPDPWPTTTGENVQDGTVLWECWGSNVIALRSVAAG